MVHAWRQVRFMCMYINSLASSLVKFLCVYVCVCVCYLKTEIIKQENKGGSMVAMAWWYIALLIISRWHIDSAQRFSLALRMKALFLYLQAQQDHKAMGTWGEGGQARSQILIDPPLHSLQTKTWPAVILQASKPFPLSIWSWDLIPKIYAETLTINECRTWW